MLPALADSALLASFAEIALAHVTREYPNKLDHVLNGPADVQVPSALHPLFTGSFDWHSNVHGYWLLATLYRCVPGLPSRTRIQSLFATRFTPARVAGELAYLERPLSATFERPYGWAWLLMLAAELSRHDDPSWSVTLEPLARAFAQRFRDWLPKATYPVRSGTHANTAFAVRLALEYATRCGDDALRDLLCTRTRDWYEKDADCQAWEPGGDDFLSPALVEAECMRRVLEPDEWRDWFARFLPRAGACEPSTLFRPAHVSDRSDGRIVHLDGLNLSRAWCWRGVASSLDDSDARRAIAAEVSDRHLEASLPHIAGDYMGEHWLATFALLALLESPHKR